MDMCETRQPPNADPIHSVRPSIHSTIHSFPFLFQVGNYWVGMQPSYLPASSHQRESWRQVRYRYIRCLGMRLPHKHLHLPRCESLLTHTAPLPFLPFTSHRAFLFLHFPALWYPRPPPPPLFLFSLIRSLVRPRIPFTFQSDLSHHLQQQQSDSRYPSIESAVSPVCPSVCLPR